MAHYQQIFNALRKDTNIQYFILTVMKHMSDRLAIYLFNTNELYENVIELHNLTERRDWVYEMVNQYVLITTKKLI